MGWKMFLRGGEELADKFKQRDKVTTEPQVGDLILTRRTADAKCYRVVDRVFLDGEPALIVEEAVIPIFLKPPATPEERARLLQLMDDDMAKLRESARRIRY